MPEYKPKTPAVVDISKVDGSPLPREIGFSTDKSRYKISKQTMGDPLINYEGKSNPYIDYQSIDLLLSLQHPRSEGYDEMCFYVMGQVKEILFKGLHFELFNAREQIKLDEINNAITILERSIEYVKFIADAWNILSTIKPEGFNQFRDYLGTASGQLSFMYRHVEFILGNKSEKMASAHKNVPHVWPEIKKNLETPSLYDEVIFYLNRKGHAISEAVLETNSLSVPVILIFVCLSTFIFIPSGTLYLISWLKHILKTNSLPFKFALKPTPFNSRFFSCPWLTPITALFTRLL